MAVLRLTLANLETEILRLTGYDASTDAPWATQANLYRIINIYGQRLPMRLTQVARQLGVVGPADTARFDMWRTVANLTTSSGSSNVDFPTDYDHWISFYDNTNARRVDPVENVDKYHIKKLRDKAAGPPEAIEIMGFLTSGANWVRRGILYPDTASGVTPSISCTYWRLPAIFAGAAPTTEYPDADYKYHALWIYGPMCEILRNSGPSYDRFQAIELELLTDLALTARAM